MDRRTIVAFIVLVCVALALAVGAVLWFGPDAQLPNVPGVSEDRASRAPSVWILFTVPAGLALLGLVAALASAVMPWPECSSEDARRSLELYRSAGRIFFVGVGVLVIGLAAVVVLRKAGVGVPPELDLRAFYFCFGLLLAYAGNFTPKMPALPDRWVGAAGLAKCYRFAGWVFVLGGILMSFAALLVPIDRIQGATQQLLYAIVGLPVLNGLLIFLTHRGKPT